MLKNNLFKRLMSLLLCFAMIAACLPVFTLNAAAENTSLNIVEDSKKADPNTLDGWTTYFGPDKKDTEFAGAVWTDKSVFASESRDLPGVTLANDTNFLVSLSAIASNMSITGHTSSPTDTMLVLDMSGSMVDNTYEVGSVRQYNSYRTATGIDMSLIQAMIDATNDTIDKLMTQNTNNRVGVVLYSGNTATNEAATVSTATVVLPLGRYTGIDSEYLSVDTTWQTAALYRYVRGRWEATGETATYVPEGTAVNVSVKNGLKTESGSNVTDSSKTAVGGTYIQNGLYQAMNQFLDDSIDTVVPEGKPQAGAKRLPIIVLMTDGAPTIATSSYNAVGTSNIGNGTSTTDQITFLTQLTAAYARGRVSAKYDKDALFLTLGLGTENSSAATNTLYPAGSNSTLVSYWNKYLAATANSNVQITSGYNGWSVYRDAAVEAMNYVDKYFYASNADDLIDSFSEIMSEIELKTGSYATLVEGGSANFSGYVTFEDELGEMMQVSDVKGLLMDDGNGNQVLYTGKGLAESMTNGKLGTVGNPTDRGNELIRTVRERIPGTSSTQAQQLVSNAYQDNQLYYTDDSNWSNYIGWYADANGNYVGFWDKDSGYENAPQGAVYANRSYGYLGVNGTSDMMHVVVMVRTELSTLHQTVLFKIPASLLPTVKYNISLAENDPTTVNTFAQETAIPMRLVFEVGLRNDVNSVNINQKIAEHLQRGGHIHRNDDGTITFYTNEWAVGNDTNQNGIPDLEEIESAHVAESHFHPALDNSRYYYTDDTVIHNESGNPASGATRPSGTGYHYDRYIYSESGRQVIKTPISETTLKNDAEYDSENGYWYIPAGTMYRNFARFKTPKTQNNPTGTLDYSFFPAVFENGEKQDVYTFLGNNGAFTVAPAQGIMLSKTVDEVSSEPDAPTQFNFVVTLSQAVEDLVFTDTDGKPISNIARVEGTKIYVTLQADQSVVISGIPTGVTYEVTEESSTFYSYTSTNASGTVAAYTVTPVDFVNTAKYNGALVVSKDVNYPEGFIPGDTHNSKEFPITVEFTGDLSGMIIPQGVIRNGNRFSLVLKDGESVTFSRIPIGVTYTVTEGQNPAGYALQELRYSDNNRTIDGNDVDEAHIVNQYTLQPVYPNVKIQGNKELIANDSSWDNEIFTVELLRIDHFADEDPVPTGLTGEMTKEYPYEIDLSSIPFTHPGIYNFLVVEQIPESRNENIAYDRTYGQFSITVGDANADGNLEIQAVHAYQGTTLSGNSTIGWTLTKDFTNVVTTDRVYLDIEKLVVDADSGAPIDAHKADITFGLFSSTDAQAPAYYALTDTHGSATLMIPVTKEIITNNGGSLVYYLREIAPAEENRVIGMNYDESWIYVIRITWDDVNNQAVVEYAPYADAQNYLPYTEGSVVFQHTNTYESDVSTNISLSGNKTLNGKTDLGGREFSFSLYKSSAAFVKGDLIRTVENSGNTIPFGNVSFTAPGIYYMVAVENKYEVVVGNETTNGGITVDTTEYHITVEVEPFTDTDGTTRLRIVSGYPHVVAYGTSTNVGATGLNFNNHYTVTGSGNVAIGGKKTLSGRTLAADEFSMGLYSDEACTDQLATAKNQANGTFSFPAITYTANHLGADYATKVYTYYVKEIVPQEAVKNETTGKYELNGVVYDDTVHEVTVTVSHANGALVVTPSENAVNLQINNSYSANPVTVTLNGKKNLSGDWSAVASKNFTFNLFAADAGFAITNEEPVKTATVNGAESFSMELTFADKQEGFYYYVLKEAIPAQRAGGVGYDAGEYHITINITDPGDGQLAAAKTIYRPGSGNVNTADFTNLYAVEPTTITLVGEKSFLNTTTNQPIPMDEGDFSFVVLENDAPVVIGYNKADGSIYFPEIRYTQAGVHNYEILEVPGEAGGVAYDNTVFNVTVTVTDNGDGTLTAEANYNNTSVRFENTYTPNAAQVTIEGTKNLSGDWSKVPAANKQFTFALYPADDQFNITGNALDEVTIDGSGNFTFSKLIYDTEATYYYVVKELTGTANIGIDYSNAEMQITVEVDDNGNGKLIPTVTTNFAGATVTPDQNDASTVTLSDLEFINTYSVAPISKVLTATKEYDGKNMLNFVFTLTGDDSTGRINDRKTVDTTTKTVTFDALNFHTAGTYTFTVEEAQTILGGFIKWDTTKYTVEIKVIDNGVGELEIESISYSDENGEPATNLAFHNGYQMEDNGLTLSVIKTMTGDSTTPKDFTFGLYADLNAEPIDTVTLSGVTNSAAKEASFQELIYKQADVATGTFTYYIKEILPMDGTEELTQKDGITYDNTVYTVVVTLTDGEAGDIGISYTVNGTDVDEVTYKFAFENKYEHIPEPTDPEPTEPAPTEPTPTEPTPTEPAPTEPTPTEPAPTEPAPTEPAPTEPTPTEPAPTEPAPTQPAPPSNTPNTGDNTNVALLATLMLFSLACLFVLVLSRKRETN